MPTSCLVRSDVTDVSLIFPYPQRTSSQSVFLNTFLTSIFTYNNVITPPLTLEEGFHGSAVGHVDWSSPGVGGEGGVGAACQQEAHHLHMVVLHGVVQRPDEKQDLIMCLRYLVTY